MSGWRIHPLHLGLLTRPRISLGRNSGETITYPIIAWFLEGGGMNILVDTGGIPPGRNPHLEPYTRAPEQEITRALKEKVKVDRGRIDMVINTHLHWDHCGNNQLFPKTRKIVQAAELEAVRSHLPPHAESYLRPIIDDLAYETVDGDVEICAGISVLLTPGHTPGLQGVLVKAQSREYFIASDTVPFFDFIRHNPPWLNIINSDPDVLRESLDRVLGLSAYILPGHDMEVFEREVYE